MIQKLNQPSLVRGVSWAGESGALKKLINNSPSRVIVSPFSHHPREWIWPLLGTPDASGVDMALERTTDRNIGGLRRTEAYEISQNRAEW
jgi:hypothetical protein